MPPPPNPDEVGTAATALASLTDAIATVLLGKTETIRLAVTALVAQGHLLIEDVPGVGKTTLARAMAAAVTGQWRRIQFTPDLLPSDVSGVTIYHQASGTFEFHPGPVFANIVIADEINRASPKTQSALLEVMEERFVTVDGVRHPVPRPFLVVATQNPVEMDGTYRLPEAQLDRFLMKLSIGYPDEAAELEVMRGDAERSPERIEPVLDTAAVARLAELARRVDVHDEIYGYIRRIAVASRRHPDIRVGLSPRACVALARGARAHALGTGRGYVLPEDVKSLAPTVCAHRLLITPDAALRGQTGADVMAGIVAEVAAPHPVSAAR
ncbi:MoxR family ATPase [Micromonospora polyrhachis]|uniref:MoxR-like ATPase n=1 Tax=Micromonospora polyrhachis TaxID=1282883 RepID=A0A7W7SRG3_9ACTN|nr:MoxR family ATPase [Micromonospora polyrhachis]MBB4958350.1 MoxR-like ATPase [Micromonospora polyrhachis]